MCSENGERKNAVHIFIHNVMFVNWDKIEGPDPKRVVVFEKQKAEQKK